MNAADFPNLSFPEALERLGAMPCVLEAALAGFEGDVVARSRDYMSQDGHQAAREFAMSRSRFLDRARALMAEEMRRTGDFLGRTITVCDLLAMMVDHDAGHREEIAALAAAR